MTEAALSSVPCMQEIVSKVAIPLDCCFVQKQMGECFGNAGCVVPWVLSLSMSDTPSRVPMGLGTAEPPLIA